MVADSRQFAILAKPRIDLVYGNRTAEARGDAGSGASQPDYGADAAGNAIPENRRGSPRGDRTPEGNEGRRGAELAVAVVRLGLTASAHCVHEHRRVVPGAH